MSPPLIAVTTYTFFMLRDHLHERTQAVAESYVSMLSQAGGMAVLIPANFGLDRVPELASRIDGILLSGGPDVDPFHFGAEPHRKLGKIDPVRDELEIALSKIALERSIPVLAICRGIQVLNVALGGTLIQDIPSHVPGHISHEVRGVVEGAGHTIDLDPESRLAKMVGSTLLRVTSDHHQAVEDVGEGLLVSAWARDGIVEAIEHKEHPFMIGLQWHPERNPTMTPDTRVILDEFMKACRS